MSYLQIYSPYDRRRRRHVVNSLLDPRPSGRNLGPALDMYETEQEVVVKMAVPGFSADDITVTLTEDVLTIKGELNEAEDKEERNYQIRERRMQRFSRTLSLPFVVNDDVAAHFENGVLSLSLPKPEEVKPQTVKITVKED